MRCAFPPYGSYGPITARIMHPLNRLVKWDSYRTNRKVAYVHVINFIKETNVFFIIARY